jgi:hypothetical protein
MSNPDQTLEIIVVIANTPKMTDRETLAKGAKLDGSSRRIWTLFAFPSLSQIRHTPIS